ncbi:organic cation/carnitine transporter 2-like isoform X3 [Plodia interpunctella]|uniref:organic cation/carnitine transporter 2-like isoform X3 n=1 Tax=Plodia interpunctella TaxID=58824 RepID=UPI002368BD72|nr:organic cation/carnitine transporter 2-like isoform X3 [Plodia interpunctella]
MSIIGTVFEDVTTDVIGSIGTWQWLVVCVCTALMIPSIFLQFEDMFLLNQVENMLCIPPSNNQVVNASLCFVQLTDNETAAKCERWYVKLMWMVWIQKSWMLFCDDKMKLVSTAMVSRVGQMFGFFIFGLISDSFGRKVSIVINVLAETSLGLLLTFCDSEGWYQLIVFLDSLCCSATKYLGLILTCEIASNEWRSWLNTIVMLPRLLAFVCMVPLANCTGNQQTYNFIAVLYGAGLVVVLRWTPESPQWLLYSRKIIKAERLLLTAAVKNGIYLCSDFKIRPVNQREKSRNLLSSIALASSIVGHALLLNITPRLFAIKVRGTLVGACQAVGEIGAILGYIIFLFDPMGSLTTMGVTIGITLTLSALCLMFLDVDGRELPDIMEDMDYFSELSKPLRWATQKTNSPSHEEVEMRIYSFNTVSSNSPERTSPARRIGFWRTWSNIRECMVNFVRRSK